MRRTSASIAMLAFVAIACGEATPTPAPTQAAATTVPTPTPVATPAPPEPTCELPCPVPEGSLTPGFEPTVTFTVGDGWTMAMDNEFITFMVHSAGSQTGLSISTEITAEDGSLVDPSPEEFIAYLEGLEALDIEDRAEVEVGGIPATQLDVRASADIFELFHNGPVGGPYRYELLADQPARIWVLAAGDATVAIVVEPGPGGELEPSLEVAAPIIDSIAFE